jgi:hypothetical protein
MEAEAHRSCVAIASPPPPIDSTTTTAVDDQKVEEEGMSEHMGMGDGRRWKEWERPAATEFLLPSTKITNRQPSRHSL